MNSVSIFLIRYAFGTIKVCYQVLGNFCFVLCWLGLSLISSFDQAILLKS
jgi:hypothetical protein